MNFEICERGRPGFLQLLGLGSERHSRYHMRSLREYSRSIVEQLSKSLDTDAGDSFVGLFMKSEPNSPTEFLVDLAGNSDENVRQEFILCARWVCAKDTNLPLTS